MMTGSKKKKKRKLYDTCVHVYRCACEDVQVFSMESNVYTQTRISEDLEMKGKICMNKLYQALSGKMR